MSNNIEKAKVLYLEHACDIQKMALNDVLEQYRNYGISAEQEKIWQQEYLLYVCTF
jgi:uncharacterized protein HemY